MVFVDGGDIFHQLAQIAAVEFGAAFAGGADESNGKTRVIGHGYDSGLAVTGVALNSDVFGIHSLIGFEIVHGAVGAPGPGAQRAPVVRFAGFALVYQADDAFLKPAPLSA